MFRYTFLASLIVPMTIIGGISGTCTPPTPDFVVVQKMANPVIRINPSDMKLTPYPPDPAKLFSFSRSINNTGPVLDDYDILISEFGMYGEVQATSKCGWNMVPVSPPWKFSGCLFGGCPIAAGYQFDSNQVNLTSLAGYINVIAEDYFNVTIAFQTKDGTKLQEVQVGMFFKKD